MEPIRAALTTDVELRLIVRLPTEAVDLIILLRTAALVANIPEKCRVGKFSTSA